MNRKIELLEPQIVWQYFKQLTLIPRPSKHEDKIRAYLSECGKKLGLEVEQTAIGNLKLRKKATVNDRPRKKIALQAHMDMVPAKDKESKHDFLNDPIDAYIDGDWVTANQTTLGADNGMGVAMALAVLASSDIKHNDLEVLFTTDEEAGMSGAFALDGRELTSEVLLNLDSEEDDEVCIGCAGGINTTINYPITYIPAQANCHSFKIELKGLFSGHSGVDIPLGRANAIKEMAALLAYLLPQLDYDLVTINGGKLRNVIPNYCTVTINVRATNIKELNNLITIYQQELQAEFANTDPDLSLIVNEVNLATQIIKHQQANALINALNAVFNGVWRMNNQLGIAETSSNVGVIETQQNQIEITSLQRSSNHFAKMKIASSIAATFKLIGAQTEHSDSYPGWQPNPQSPTLAVIKALYHELFKHEIKVSATHGGLECGLILDKFPSLDAVSIGATVRYPHSVNEKVNIPSVDKSWRLLKNLIERL